MTVIQAGTHVTCISPEDSDLAGERWFTNAAGYILGRRGSRYAMQRLHRVIMARMVNRPLARDEFVDHADGDRCNNQRDNLRLATRSQNGFNRGRPAHNTTGYKGVYRNSVGCRLPWQAAITVNQKKIYLGSYATRRDAARAYDAAARQVAGPFARGNQ